jgi:hypothetical protein
MAINCIMAKGIFEKKHSGFFGKTVGFHKKSFDKRGKLYDF